MSNTFVENASSGAPREAQDHNLETILAVVTKINTSLVLSEVLAMVLAEAIRITAAERGILMLANADRRLEFVMGTTASGENIDTETFRVSSTVLNDVFTTGESLCIESALQDARFERKESVMDLELQTILCSPLRTSDETIGVIYVDSKFIQPVDRAETLNMFEILAGQAAIAIKNARLYENLRSAYRDLSEANEQVVKFERMATKGQFIAEVSHELKNMVGVLAMSVDLLKMRLAGHPDPKVHEDLEKAVFGADSLCSFTETLQSRELAKGNMTQKDPNKVVRGFVDFIRVLPRFSRCTLSVVPGESVPQVLMDADQIQQVLLNLVMNALEARSDATIVVMTAHDEENSMVSIAVSDNGPGIEESVLSRLFKEQVTTKPDGHGYGLRVCRRVLQNHGGTISVRTCLHEGTTFELRIPVPKA